MARFVEDLQKRLLHLVAHKRCVFSYDSHDYKEQYFKNGFIEAKKFFSRFGGCFDIGHAIQTFLDVGSGYGSTCIYLAQQGARHVTGVDIREQVVDFANEKLNTEYLHLKDRVTFKMLSDLGNEQFDVVISKDSFEHYSDPAGTLKQIYKWLKPGGRLYLGFSPLWKSPYGGHMNRVTDFPWAHLIFPEKVMLEELQRLTGESVDHYGDIGGGLNQMTLRRFERLLAESDYTIVCVRTNVSQHWVLSVFNILRSIPFCREFFTVNAYAILQK